jgi:hypothetical protein
MYIIALHQKLNEKYLAGTLSQSEARRRMRLRRADEKMRLDDPEDAVALAALVSNFDEMSGLLFR